MDAKKIFEAPVSRSFEEAIINVVEQCRLDALLKCIAKKLADPDRCMVAFYQCMVGNDGPIKPVVHFLKHHINNIKYKCLLERILEWAEKINQILHTNNDTVYRLPQRTRILSVNPSAKGFRTVTAEIAMIQIGSRSVNGYYLFNRHKSHKKFKKKGTTDEYDESLEYPKSQRRFIWRGPRKDFQRSVAFRNAPRTKT